MSYIEGDIKQILFYNDENNYSVLKLSIIDTDEQEIIFTEPTIIICGFFPQLERYQRYRFYGLIKNHPKYGIQFDASRFERVMDNSIEGLVDYLSSDLFKGIGPKTARQIIDTLGLDAIEKIINQPDVLNSIPRMTEQKKAVLVSTILTNRKLETTLVWLYGFQISPKMAMKIYQKFGYESVDVIKSNPYILMDEIEGIGFKRADEIGLKIGFSYNDPLRIKAVIMFLLNEYMNKYGDTYLETNQLVQYTLQYLNTFEDFKVSMIEIEQSVTDLIFSSKIISTDDKLSLSYLYSCEKSVALKCSLFIDAIGEEFSETIIDQTIALFQQISYIDYTEEQIKAIKTAILKPFVIITGGPGTGKTTIINGIVKIYKMLTNPSVN
ncbi:MAG: helix-hairpin-helix domain-containing protein, partial [Candidatus Izemoplasmatales bacterium]|nr:helix-hairpin-helix domain-containing protein [Candidatus Izemoplasmatales bacterium]